ncbi:metal-dependent membrane protease, CAAX family protein [Fictibacillus macauensis ZFHKF-1]|uniref:Metal-dependent membrane protease, CAAX family protein n=1 Tax=Fictibacillus macauensis ZFHKF-1 TaxID=1196324 RepID=I8AIZ6_9BACL|nr:type II CAAX endopeptidase family protein [Fictibacillus macauensis]EIT85752.1 metal-dependent membrane protease, CAAX family protein [Fictibacillus macauensis ZFHKF-1]
MNNPQAELQTIDIEYKGKRSNTAPISWGELFGFIGTYIGFSIVSYLLALLFSLSYGITFHLSLEDLQGNPLFELLDGVTFLCTILVFKRVRQFVWRSVSFAALKKGKTYFLILLALVLCQTLQYLIFQVWGIETPQADNDSNILLPKALELIFFIISTCIVAPITEELFFRGILYRFVTDKFHFTLGILVSAAVFGSLHFGYPLAAGLMGVIFALLYYLTKSLVPGIVVHALWNSYVTVSAIIATYSF